jgi:hypothetical protein
VDFDFVCAEVGWVIETPQPTKPADPIRDDKDDDDAWQKKKRDHAPVEMRYTQRTKSGRQPIRNAWHYKEHN